MEYDSKAAVAAVMEELVAGPLVAMTEANAEGGGGSVGDARGTAVLDEVRRPGGAFAKCSPDLCTTYLCVWMLSPYLEDEQADEALGAVTEDMVSF